MKNLILCSLLASFAMTVGAYAETNASASTTTSEHKDYDSIDAAPEEKE